MATRARWFGIAAAAAVVAALWLWWRPRPPRPQSAPQAASSTRARLAWPSRASGLRDEADDASIGGFVRDDAGAPIAGAVVTVSSLAGDGEEDPNPVLAPSPTATAATDGSFSVRGLRPGRFGVTATALGFRSASAPDVTLEEAASVGGVVITLGKGGFVLRGHVIERGSGPVAAVSIRATGSQEDGAKGPAFGTIADAKGAYELRLAPGTYAVEATLRGYLSEQATVELDADKAHDIALGPAGRVRGTVVQRRDGVPVAGARVVVRYPQQLLVLDQATTDERGVFEMMRVPPGVFEVSARRGNLVGEIPTVAVPVATTVDGLHIAVDEGLVLAGRVIDRAQRPIAGARISIGGEYQTLSTVKSDGAGAWKIEGLRAGRYLLTADATGHPQGRRRMDLLPSGHPEPIDFVMLAGAVIRGRVVASDGTPALAASVAVTVDMPRAGYLIPDTHRAQTETGPQGAFRLEGLPAGPASVSARLGNRSGKGSLEALPEGSTHDVVLELADEVADDAEPDGDDAAKGPLAITGVVVRADGRPEPGAFVGVDSEAARGSQSSIYPIGGPYAAPVALDGTFRIEKLTDGLYTVWAKVPGAPLSRTRGVAAGASGVRVRVPASGSVAGVVVDKKGKSVGDVAVQAVPLFDAWLSG